MRRVLTVNHSNRNMASLSSNNNMDKRRNMANHSNNTHNHNKHTDRHRKVMDKANKHMYKANKHMDNSSNHMANHLDLASLLPMEGNNRMEVQLQGSRRRHMATCVDTMRELLGTFADQSW